MSRWFAPLLVVSMVVAIVAPSGDVGATEPVVESDTYDYGGAEVLLPTDAPPPVDGDPDVPWLDATSAAQEDARVLAAAMGWSIDEAIAYGQAGVRAGPVNALLEQDTGRHGGLWLEMRNGTPWLVVQYVGKADAARQAVHEMLRGELDVEFRPVPTSLAAELDRLARVREVLASVAPRAASDFDVRTRSISVHVGSVAERASINGALARERAAGQQDMVADVEVVQLAATPAVDITAGLASIPACTTGFVAKRIYEYGYLSAAHCSNNPTVSGKSSFTRAEQNYGSADLQFSSTQGTMTPRNQMYNGSYTRDITSTVARPSQVVGQALCTYGKTTGNDCGTLLTKNYAPSPDHANHFMIIEHPSYEDYLVWGGDSGGPVYWGNAAYGINHAASHIGGECAGAGNPNAWPPSSSECSFTNAVYTGINYSSVLNSTVLTGAATDIQLLYNTGYTNGSVNHWNRSPLGMNWAVYGGGPGGSNRLEFNCAPVSAGCSVYNQRNMLTNQKATYRLNADLYCNSGAWCPVRLALWGIGGAANQVAVENLLLPPNSWTSRQFYVTYTLAHTALRFEVYNDSAYQNVDVSNARVYTDQ